MRTTLSKVGTTDIQNSKATEYTELQNVCYFATHPKKLYREKFGKSETYLLLEDKNVYFGRTKKRTRFKISKYCHEIAVLMLLKLFLPKEENDKDLGRL